MRILRGKSSLEVSSQGFAWFVVGLVLASFLGGAVRTVLTSDRVHRRIVSELRKQFPKHEFQIQRTDVLLSRGLWPGLALRLQGVHFRQETCDKLSFAVAVPEAVLPVDLLSLRKGRLRLGHVEMSGGKIQLGYRSCMPAPSEVASAETTPAIVPAPKKPALRPQALDWRKVGEHLDGLELHGFHLTFEGNANWKVVIKYMDVELGRELAAQGVLEVQKSLPFGTKAHEVEIDASGDEHVLQWNVHSEFKEGRVSLKGSTDFTNNSAMARFEARQLPVKEVVAELHQMGLVENDIRLRAMWLSCVGQWEGQMDQVAAMPVVIRDCRVEGGYGRLALDRADLWPGQADWLKTPATLKVQQLQVQPLLEALNRKFLPTVLARLGVWSGAISYLNHDSWQIVGDLENMELTFSHRSVRGKQIIEHMQTEVRRVGERVTAEIKDLKIQDGDFSGVIRLDLSKDWRSGGFETNIERIRFSPAIQSLLVGGNLGELKITGKGSLQEGELSHWTGEFDLSAIRAAGWSAQGLVIKSRYIPGTFFVDGKARQAEVNSSWPLFSQLQLIEPSVQSPTQWQDLTARMEIHKTGGTVHAVSGLENGRSWRLKGNWIRDGEFNGVLGVGQGSKARTFALRGEKGLLVVQDQTGVTR